MTMPIRYRMTLVDSCGPDVTLTRHPDGCVLIYPRAVWLEKKKALAALPSSARMLQRFVLGSAVDLSIDSAGRLLIPSELRVLCSLDKDVALVGLGEHFEVWNAPKLTELEAAASQELAAAVADFHF